MRQVMPHRNNMSLHRNKSKRFLLGSAANARSATILQQQPQARKTAGGKERYEKQWFTCFRFARPVGDLTCIGMADMRLMQFRQDLSGGLA
jgi:hypothetical protein